MAVILSSTDGNAAAAVVVAIVVVCEREEEEVPTRIATGAAPWAGATGSGNHPMDQHPIVWPLKQKKEEKEESS